MKSQYEILNTLQIDISSDLPALLTDAGLPDFAEYVTGPPRKHEQSTFSIYIDEDYGDDVENRITLIFQLQLFSVDFHDGIKYSDVFKDYIRSYRPDNIGMNILDNVNSDIWPIDKTRTMFIFYTVSYSEMLDSCDSED